MLEGRAENRDSRCSERIKREEGNSAERERPGAAGFAEPVVLEKTRLKVVGFGDFFLGFEVTSRICGGRSESGGGGRD